MRPIRFALPAAALALLAACGESSTAPGGETELITRVTLLVDGGGQSQTTFIEDADGNGPGAPAAQSAPLNFVAGTTYTGTILFENRLENPPENITEEVEEEDDEHRVFYLPVGSGITVTTTDTDGDGAPLGLTYTINASAAGTGTLRVVLCHYDDDPKSAAATSCDAETDIDVGFAYTVSAN